MIDGLHRVGPVVVISGPAAQILRDAVLIAERSRRLNGLPASADYKQIAQEFHAAMSGSGQSDITTEAHLHAESVGPTVPIEQAAAELGISKRQARRLAPDLGGRIVGGRWLIDRLALNEHLKGKSCH